MAKKNIPSATDKKSVVKSSAPVVTPVRNSAVPPKSAAIAAAPAKKLAPTRDAIALRAYFIWKSTGGCEFDNWIRAERELSI